MHATLQQGLMTLALSSLLTASAVAQAPTGAHDAHGAQGTAGASDTPASSAAASTPAAQSTAAEVRRIDLAQLKITLRHEEITHLNMPPMSMVFRVGDKAQLQNLKPGDAVRFVAEKKGGEYWASELQRVP